MVSMRLGPTPSFFVSHPDFIKHVLQENHRGYHKSPLYENIKTTFGDGLLTSEDDFWLRQRRLAQPAFHRARLAELAREMTGATERMLDRWAGLAERQEPIDVAQEMMHLTQEIIMRSMFRSHLDPHEIEEIDRYATESDLNIWAASREG